MAVEIKISKEKIPYKTAVNYLEKRVQEVKNGKKDDLLWILEHPLTFSAGVRSSNLDVLDKNIKLIRSKRGGKITLHNPGQKIIYFVIDLNKRKKDIRRFISFIEKSIIDFLKTINIKSRADKKNIGIWVDNKKIAAIGVRVSKWVVYHGCSININNNLSDYKKINPCGLDNKNITSIQEIKKKKLKVNEKEILEIFSKNLKLL
tara:strand:- start:511 stop:1122 length:612 start_codon:yes stop_codon:yes gene_type:complete